MVELEALKNCTISFLYNGIPLRFKLNKYEVFQETDDFIITKLLNTKLVKQI